MLIFSFLLITFMRPVLSVIVFLVFDTFSSKALSLSFADAGSSGLPLPSLMNLVSFSISALVSLTALFSSPYEVIRRSIVG